MRKAYNILFSIVGVILPLRFVFLIFGLSKIGSLLFTLVYALIAVIDFLGIAMLLLNLQKIPRASFLNILLSILVIIFAIVALIYRKNNYFLPLESTLVFIEMIILLLIFPQIYIDDFVLSFFFSLNFFVSIIIAVTPFLPQFYRGNELLLYTHNTNQAALVFYSLFISNMIFLSKMSKHRLVRIVIICTQLFLIYGVVITKSRTVFFSCLLALLFCFVFKNGNKKIKGKTVGRIFIWSMLLIIPLYIYMGTYLENYFVFGKDLMSGRHSLWKVVCENCLANPFSSHLGQYTLESWNGGLNAHNLFLDISWKYSLMCALLFGILFYRFIEQYFGETNNKFQRVVLACFASGFLHMLFEGTLISSSLDFSLYFLLPLLLVRTKEQRKNVTQGVGNNSSV